MLCGWIEMEGKTMRKIEKVISIAREEFEDRINRAALEHLGVEITTLFNIADMQLVSYRVDEEPFTSEQKNWLDGFSAAYSEALDALMDMNLREIDEKEDREAKKKAP